MPIPFDSQKLFYRTPFGAVEQGTTVHFRILLPRAERSKYTELCVKYDYDYNWEYIKLIWCGAFDDTTEIWECEFTPDRVGLYWYGFRLQTPTGNRYLQPADAYKISTIEDSPGRSWQLTCYKKGFETPKWPVGGVMYQIFPDRFYKQGDFLNQREECYYHQDWYDDPILMPEGGDDNCARDFFGGNLAGITEKLPYLKDLGVTVLYLNPIFQARSNHRYDTSDYKRVDPILGTNEDFTHLCETAEKMGIRIMLDGVFSHTGADSIYFNRYHHYASKGACQGQDSPYYSWYEFRSFPNDYRSWWGFADLPEVEETNPAWQEQVVTGEDSVVKTWLRRGAAGWRLDVADELPDEVLSLIRRAAKEEKPDAPVLGEVWEDPVVKESYGSRRNYALGYSLDSVMNYPFRSAVLDFAHWRCDAYALRDFLRSQQMNYPQPLYYSLMNLLGSHDVDRVRSALATDVVIRDLCREDQLRLSFSEERLERAITLEKLCAAIQFTVPGVPSVYYGDEQGMCGVGDPFNRGPFKLGDRDLHDCYASLAAARNASAALSTGFARFMADSPDLLLILRWIEDGKDALGLPAEDGAYLTVINRASAPAYYTADCTAAGKGYLSGSIGPCTWDIIKL